MPSRRWHARLAAQCWKAPAAERPSLLPERAKEESVNDKAMEVAARLATEVAPDVLEWLGSVLWGKTGAEVGKAVGEMLREGNR